MYVGDPADGSGIVSMVLEVLASAYDQYLLGRCSRIGITIAADGTIIVEDDGPGMLAIDALLTAPPAVGGPRAHLGAGGGLFVVNALSERFELVTVRAGVEARTAYARGDVAEPLTTIATQRANGTSIRFLPDATIFPHARCPRTELTRKLEDLTFVASGLRLTWSFEGDDVATRGLVGRVAIAVPCDDHEVARHRGIYATAKGPVDVEVALGWRSNRSPALIDSYVNLGRTRDDGCHVDGLRDGVAAFLGCVDDTGLVAAVAVILTDVILSNPARDRLDSLEARAPVFEATVTALTAWALARPEAAAAVKRRHQ
jgi:DNA gyrase/topoisomerase IV subunit B